MINFNEKHYREVVEAALKLRPEIENAVDKVCEEGYSNIFFIGCGGTWAHTLCMKYWLDHHSSIDSYCEIAAEFMAGGHKKFSKDSICVFSSRSGNTKEIVAAAEYCKKLGARTMIYVSNDNTPVCEFADYKFYSPAEDDNLAEAIYTYMIILLGRFMKNKGEFDDYDVMMNEMERVTPYLIKAKETYELRGAEIAKKIKDTKYEMVIGSGMLWGEAYDYAMCILEEMQWIKTKSIHACEFFHGTIELVEKDTDIIMLYGEDETEKLMDRVKKFSGTITENIHVFDTKDIELPFSKEYFRMIYSPITIYTILECLSRNLAIERDHALTVRRYYRQMEY